MKTTENTAKTEPRNLKGFLQETLVTRVKANPAYSMRAFARALALEPSFLSKLLSGKRRATPAVVKKIALKLSLGINETEQFLREAKGLSVEADSDQPFRSLQVDQFQMIADWYHYAILELMSIDGFQSDAKWISKKLGIKLIEVQAALERLERLEMIEKNEQGAFGNISGSNTTVGNDFTAVAFKKLQKQILDQAITALAEVEYEERDQSSLTIAMDPELLPEIKEKIKKFRRELAAHINKNSKIKSKIYQLSVSYFPVTKE